MNEHNDNRTPFDMSVPMHVFPPGELPVVPGFVGLTEVGRGGMAIVYRAHDIALNRDVAVKVLRDRYLADGLAAQRFVEESRITSQLQHPGIPPIHQVGTLGDGRLFFVMKLIKGRTLDELLKERRAADNRGRFVAVFEQICQTVGYAHAHNVIHRDLKPANIMVGAFGVVQVMDWGLSKSLTDAPAVHTIAVTDEPATTAIGAIRDPDLATQTGSVLGTPAFMPPEQARGEIAKIDARSDVFGLGAVLCIILTGEPPYVGDSTEAVRLMAVRGQLDGALARLDACGAEPELVALCKRCLSVEPADRLEDANELAAAVAGFRADAEERARRAVLDRVRVEGEQAKVEAETREHRKRRKVQLALAVSVALLLAVGGGFAWYTDRQASERKLKDERAEAERQRTDAVGKATEARLAGERDTEQRLKAEQARQGIAANLELAGDLRRQYKFQQAEAALAQAVKLAEGGAPGLLAGVKQAQADLAFVVKLDGIRFRKWIWIAEEGGKGHFNEKIVSPEYRATFVDRSLDLQTLAPAEAAKRIAASGVKAEIVAAVDDWALYEPDATLRDRLLEIARKADPGAWTDRLRDPAAWEDKVVVAKLAADADPGTTSPAALSVLAELMQRSTLDPVPLLSAARAKHPTEFELAFALGLWHAENRKEGQPIGPYEAARALRPENLAVWNNLGVALYEKGDIDEAIVTYKEVVKHDPKYAAAHNNLGAALKSQSDIDGAIAAFREAIKHDPKLVPAHYSLGVVLHGKGDVDGAIVAYKEAIKRDPKHALAHNNLGVALKGNGDIDGAIAAYKEAIKHDPKHAPTHYNLGAIYLQQKKYAEAIAYAREAIKADPKFPNVHAMLGVALRESGDIPGARVALTEAARLDPKRWAPSLAKLPPVVPVAPAPREVNR